MLYSNINRANAAVTTRRSIAHPHAIANFQVETTRDSQVTSYWLVYFFVSFYLVSRLTEKLEKCSKVFLLVLYTCGLSAGRLGDPRLTEARVFPVRHR